jgi:hypothetical protein
MWENGLVEGELLKLSSKLPAKSMPTQSCSTILMFKMKVDSCSRTITALKKKDACTSDCILI